MTTRTWFITGASSGLGREMTEQLLARGDRVAATVRQPAVLDALKAAHGERLWVARLDLTDTPAIAATVRRAFAELGRIDVVVNNAGYAVFGAAEEASPAQVRHQIDTNLTGSIELIRAVLPHLRGQGGGRVLQVSSEGGQLAYPNFSLYHATKWGIEGFVEAVAQEVAPFHIEFTLVEPGPANTGFAAGLVHTAPMPAYQQTPAGAMRRAMADGSFAIPGNAGKIVQAMLGSVDTSPAPRRLTLGAGAYQRIRAALLERLAALDGQQAIACSTDDA